MKKRKILSIALVLALIFSIFAVNASAAGTVSNVGVYISGVNTIGACPYELSSVSDVDNDGVVSALDAAKTAYSSFNYYDSNGGIWFYTVNSKLATYSAKDYELSSGDFLAFYFVPDYTTDGILAPSYYTDYVDSNGRLNTYGSTIALSNDYGMEISLDYSEPTAKYLAISTSYATSNNSSIADGYIFIAPSGTITGRTVFTTCYPVKTSCSDWRSNISSNVALITSTTNGISSTEIGTTPKSQLNTYATAVANTSNTDAQLVSAMATWEDYFVSLTYSVDARLASVSFSDSLAVSSPFFPYFGAYTVQSSTADPTAVPTHFTMTVDPKDSTATIQVGSTSTGVSISGTGNTRSITLPANATSTITVTVTKSGVSKQYTFTFTTPAASNTSNGGTPYAIVSYLPIGQYATGAGWGSMYTNYNNANGQNATDAVQKFVNGYTATGVSLGALGGYIEFDFDNPSTPAVVEGIKNDPRNPYGVDLVVYGNAFNGNPEAGAVQVGWEHDGTVTWYELAGSRYYEDNYNFVGNQGGNNKYVNAYSGTLCDTTATYKLTSSDIKVTLGTDGPNTFTTARAWWPTKTEYPEFNVSTYPTSGNAHTDSNVTVAYGGDANNNTLTFGGVTAVQDSNTTSFYAFGYADVTPNGNPSIYGDAINPYIPYTTNKQGGDGFDLEWAVDIDTKLPVDVTGKTFRYVRVYSAVLDNATFNETSTEVNGIFTAYRTTTENGLDATTGVGRTADPSITIANTAIATFALNKGILPTQIGNVTYYDLTGKIPTGTSISATGATYTYVNGTNSTPMITTATTGFVRIVAQTGDAAPSITLIKVN